MTAANPEALLECVINISEGIDRAVIAATARAGAGALLDVHSDPDHNRSVITLGGPRPLVESAARAVTLKAVELIDIGAHRGVHPRFGAVDVVPFVTLNQTPSPAGNAGEGQTEHPGRSAGEGQRLHPAPSAGGGRRPAMPANRVTPGDLAGGVRRPAMPAKRVTPGDLAGAVEARDRFARWAAAEVKLPCFLYGPERTLPEVRRQAWKELQPDFGPSSPHPTAGAAAAGARPALVAYNLWLAQPDIEAAKRVAKELRSPAVRTLALGWDKPAGAVQVSCNLIDPWTVGPAAVFDFVASRVEVERAELVGLLPGAALDDVPASRWQELNLSAEATIEARLDTGFDARA